jgi:tripartite-type tricarboxylate transporter receptor subunit TctC
MMNQKSLYTILLLGVIVAAVAVVYVFKFNIFGDDLGETGDRVASEDSGARFFKDKTITYIVSTNPGGNYDAYGRLIAGYMEKHLAGARIVVKNVPGAGHIIGANQIYNANPDGLTIGTFNTGLIYAQILEREGIHFDLADMSYLGKAAAEPRALIISAKGPYQSLLDLQNAKEPVKLAAAGVGSAAYAETKLISDAFHLNVELITGYHGNAGEMAMLRGEVQGQLGSLSSLQGFVDSGGGRIVMQVGGDPTDGVPRASDLANSETARAIVKLIVSQAELARVTAGPPGIPLDRLGVLRAAYRAALEDPELLAETKRRGMPIEPLYGEKVREQVVAALNQSPQTRALIAKAMPIDE